MLRHGLICKDKDINEDRRTRKAGTIQCTCINLNPGYVHKSGSEVGVISTWMLSLKGTPPPHSYLLSFILYHQFESFTNVGPLPSMEPDVGPTMF